jgi:hypothetical protein
MGEAQRAGKGIKGKTEGTNDRGPEGRKENKRDRAGMVEAQRAARGIKGKTEGRHWRVLQDRKGNKKEDREQEWESPRGQEGE